MHVSAQCNIRKRICTGHGVVSIVSQWKLYHVSLVKQESTTTDTASVVTYLLCFQKAPVFVRALERRTHWVSYSHFPLDGSECKVMYEELERLLIGRKIDSPL